MTITKFVPAKQFTSSDLPRELRKTLTAFGHLTTSQQFHFELDARLGALLSIAGIGYELCSNEPTCADGSAESLLTLPIEFTDGTRYLSFEFELEELSREARSRIYSTMTTVLGDRLKVLSAEKSTQSLLDHDLLSSSIASRMQPATSGTTTELAANQSGVPVEGKTVTSDAVEKFAPPHLAADFAHKLRNSLTAIMSSASQLIDSYGEAHEPDDLVLLQVIEQAAALQRQLIDRYLMLYAPMKINLKKLNLHTLLSSIFNEHDQQNGRTTEFHGCPEDRFITTDPRLLAALLNELLANAYEAQREITLSVRCDLYGSKAVLYIKNQGEIASADFYSKYCKPFFSGKSGHSGLGLPIANRYAAAIGGTIKAVSIHGYTVVALALPLGKE